MLVNVEIRDCEEENSNRNNDDDDDFHAVNEDLRLCSSLIEDE